jgi:Zn-dependent protease
VIYLAWIAIFLVSLMTHEVCHGLVAYALGDPTAKNEGRLSFNPLRHIDPFWTILLPALFFFTTGGRFAIGMAKPVPVDFRRLHHPKRDMIWVALAGPFANLLLASVLSLVFKLTDREILLYAVYFNLGLAMFNLIPIPPLDGSRVLAGLLPPSWAYRYLKIEPYGYVLILLLYFSRVLIHVILPGINFFCRILGIPILSF